MSAFRFALEPLLTLRRMEEERTQRAVALIERERAEIEERIRTQQGHIHEGKESLRSGLVGQLDVTQLRQQAASSMQVSRKTHQLVIRLAGVHQRLAQARAALVEAMRARRAIEILREKRFEEWRAEQGRREIRELDDLSQRKDRLI